MSDHAHHWYGTVCLVCGIVDSVFAIDPGTTRSAWVLLGRGAPVEHGIVDNEDLLDILVEGPGGCVVIEKVESFGMAVGAEVFETVFWAGRFAQASPSPFDRIGRKAVKAHLCGSTRAKDANIRQALIDRFGGPDSIRKGGPLYGVKADIWAALAVAVTWRDLNTAALEAA